MNRHPVSPAKVRAALRLLAPLAVALAVGASLHASAQASEHTFNDNCLPPRNAQYIAQLHQQYAAGLINLKDPQHADFVNCDPPPGPNGTTIHSMGSFVQCKISTDGGNTYQPHSAPCQMTVRVHNAGQVGNTTHFDTEMLQLDITGGTLPPGVMIRESPTLASTGQTTIRPSGSNFLIDSFFDIFTELSLDGGQTWMPSDNGAGHMTMDALNPTPARNSTWGSIKIIYR